MLFTQSGLCWWNQSDHRWELPGSDQTCALFSVPAGGLTNFTATLFFTLIFHWELRLSLRPLQGYCSAYHSHPGHRFLLPFISEYTPGVSDTRGRGRLAQPVLNPIPLQWGNGKGLRCHFTCNTIPTCSPLSVEPPRHKSYMVFLWHTAAGALHLW